MEPCAKPDICDTSSHNASTANCLQEIAVATQPTQASATLASAGEKLYFDAGSHMVMFSSFELLDCAANKAGLPTRRKVTRAVLKHRG